MASPGSAHRREADSDERLSYKKVDGVVSVLRTLIMYTAIVLIARYAYLSVAVLAGKLTWADVGIRVLGNVKISDGIAYILGGGGVIYGMGQRQLRRRSVERLTPAKNELEHRLDNNRTSSHLTKWGTTRPEDKL